VEPTWDMVRAEQQECAALFRSLSSDEWEAPTLCAGWTVRDMLSHIASTIVMNPAHAIRVVRFRKDIDRLNQTTIDAWRDRPTASLIDRIEHAKVPSIGQRIVGRGNSLRALVIHQQDVRRPLNRPRRLDPDRVRAVLDAILDDSGGNLGSVERAGGLRLVAEDIDWSHGSGLEVRGPAAAVLMALAGRTDGLRHLSGPGVERLATGS
jgi:uncharacterized protein (TIGR03083 family)